MVQVSFAFQETLHDMHMVALVAVGWDLVIQMGVEIAHLVGGFFFWQ